MKKIILQAGAMLLYMTCCGGLLSPIVAPFSQNLYLVAISIVVCLISLAFLKRNADKLVDFILS